KKNIDLWSSEEYESDVSNVDIAYNFQEDIYDFEEDDNELDSERANLIINHLLTVSAASIKKKKHPPFILGTQNERNKEKIKSVNESPSENESESENNESMTEYEKEIQKTIEFVNDVICNEQLSNTEKARYMAVMYYLRLLFNGKKKIQASEAVAEVVNGRPWLARC
ncbi:4699_t:CDS:2, partial [Cetraspora pellucida]